MQIKTVLLEDLLPHEHHNLARCRRLAKNIKKTARLRRPLLVDGKTGIVLDGHHRLAALKLLGCKRARVLAVDYRSDEVKLLPRRKNILVNKNEVIKRGQSNSLYPVKTTKHQVVGGRASSSTRLDRLW